MENNATMKISRKMFCIAVCTICTGYFVWSNPFTSKRYMPEPVRTEKPSEFLTVQQAKLHTQLGEYIYEWSKTNSVQAFQSIMLLAFLYGFFHALGPGHRKTIVFSFYLGREAPVWEPLVTGCSLAALHGVTTIALLYIFRNVKGAFSGNTSAAALYMEAGSFFLLIILSVLSLLHIAAHIFPHKLRFFHFGCNCGIPTKEGHSTDHACTCSHGDGNSLHKEERVNHEGCSCCTEPHNHRHSGGNTPSAKIQWGAFLLSGLYPCPAALLVMVLVLSLDAVGLGIISIISMSLGMAIPVTAAAYLAWAGRSRLFHRLGETGTYVRIVSLVLGITAYTAILIFSILAVRPFIGSLTAQLFG